METNNSQSVNVAGQENDIVTPAMESLRQLRWSMAQVLTPKQYQVFTLHFLEGIPQKEVAAELGMPRSAVCISYNSALKKLRRLWNT